MAVCFWKLDTKFSFRFFKMFMAFDFHFVSTNLVRVNVSFFIQPLHNFLNAIKIRMLKQLSPKFDKKNV